MVMRVCGQIMLRRMVQMIRQQIYSARRAAEFEYGSAGRIGFAWFENWNDGTNNAVYADLLATNLARALRDAYRGDRPAAACSDNDGTGTLYYGCPPSAKPGASINSEWDKLKTWDGVGE